MTDKRQKLTKTLVDQAVYPYPGQKRFFVLWDAALPRFGLRVYPSGRKAFTVIYRFQGRQRTMTLGPYGVLTVQQARQFAREILVKVACRWDRDFESSRGRYRRPPASDSRQVLPATSGGRGRTAIRLVTSVTGVTAPIRHRSTLLASSAPRRT